MTDAWEELCVNLQAQAELERTVSLAANTYSFYDSLIKFGMEPETALELTKYYLFILAYKDKV